jgi:MFS family permease
MARSAPAAVERPTGATVVAASGFGVQAVVFGVLYTFGVVLEPIRDDLGASTSMVALLPAVSSFVLFFAGPVTGWLADRRGTHTTVAVGGALLAVGLVMTSLAPSAVPAVASYGLLGGFAASLAYVPVIAHVAALPTRRAPALVGVVVAGVGVGSAVAAPVLEWAVGEIGWRATYRTYAVLAVVGLGAASTVFAPRASPSGPPVASRRDGGPPSLLAALRPLFADGTGRRLYLALLLVCPAIYLGLIFLPSYATSRGIPGGRAAVAAAVLAVGSAGGRLVLGWLGARFPPVSLFRLSLVLLAVSLIIWLLAGSSYPLLLLYAAVAGTGYGGTVGLAPTVAAERYGRDGLGALLGGLYTAFGAGALITGPAAGAVIDRAGYAPTFVTVGAMAAVGAAIVPRPRQASSVTASA